MLSDYATFESALIVTNIIDWNEIGYSTFNPGRGGFSFIFQQFPLGRHEPTCSLPRYWKIVVQTVFKEKENSLFKSAMLRLKIDLVVEQLKKYNS